MVKDYLADSRAPRYSVLFALPLLLLYETAAFILNSSATAGIRNGADVILKSLFVSYGGRRGLVVFDALLLGSGAAVAWRDKKKNPGPLEGRIFVMMFVEAAVYAALFGIVVGRLTALVLGMPQLLDAGAGQLDFTTRLVTSLGAGIYEELLFRVLLTGGLVLLCRVVLGLAGFAGKAIAVVLSALIFSSFHYIGSLGDTFTMQSFIFRAIAGLIFSALYVTRGLGITAWTHALYDVMLTILQT
ncbi:MAG TPA: CPBP family intramembrane glutamic endopeptidase [Gemmatimonadales bacterium]|jgi:hypothetical protein